ncbi:NUDIX hydrolase [Meiothermus sp.]|uniref:NUDIX hydrolase n=1 Tax=Meiothermus sp. TaxID=1955249 RepID=UPI0021DC245E|nr:NUDIX hydrolase [Meiothermus sp.]GIW24026.1 MAG: diadenosine hexaphosphate hydrolase [Meiothermus sp.]
MKTPVLGAGGVLFDPEGKVLLIRDRQGYWCFPKGHLDEGERLEQAALREVEEETGIQGRVKQALSVTRYQNNKGIPREIHWFLMEGQGSLRLEKGLQGAGFFDPAEARRLLAFPEDVRLLDEALRHIQGRNFDID